VAKSQVLGVVLLITPFVFGIATFGSTSLDVWILGAVVSVVAVILALLWLGFPSNRVTEEMTVMVGLVLFISPWVLGEAVLTADAWASWIIGVLLIIAAGGVSAAHWKRQVAIPTHRSWHKLTNHR
jgi:MFS-type transporter involved in bile tolerance (Atg22 family)